MAKFGALVLAAILVFFSGCAKVDSPKESAVFNDVGSEARKPKPVEETTKADRVKKLPADKQKDKAAKEENGSVKDGGTAAKSIPVQPGPARSEKLNFNILDKLDNTKYGWGLDLNSSHSTPGVPSYAKKLLAKYNGVYVGDTSKKVVYLTFDEGYENGYTHKILDTLKADGVKALFFVTGPYIKEQPALVKRMLAEGHQVGNHSINHPSLPAMSDPGLENELYGLEKQFNAVTGKGFKYMRPPMGEYSERVLAAAAQLGYKTVFWSYAYKDYDTKDQKGPDHAYNLVMKNLHNGAVILLHAVSRDNAEALDRIIKGIRAEGYEIKAFDL